MFEPLALLLRCQRQVFRFGGQVVQRCIVLETTQSALFLPYRATLYYYQYTSTQLV